MKITLKQIHSISQDLQSGLEIFINKETYEIKSLLNSNDLYSDTEYWEEEFEKIENEWSDYVIISKMESREAFQIMEDFVDEIGDPKLKGDLIKILNRKSPFANFKQEVESSAFRQKWFNFKDRKYEDYVKDWLEVEEIKSE